MLNKDEILQEFEDAMGAEFTPALEPRIAYALKSIIAKFSPMKLTPPMTLPDYIALLEKEEVFTIKEVSILVNHFNSAGYKHFDDIGFTLEEYKQLAHDLGILSLRWEELAGPARKTFNQKMQIISPQKNRGQNNFLS